VVGGRSDAGTARESVQGDALTEQELAHWAVDGGTVRYGGDLVAFGDVPFYAGVAAQADVSSKSADDLRAVQLREYFIKEWNAR
jgi:hypothetical protein